MLRTRLYAVHTVKGAPASKAIKAWKKTGLKPGAPLHAEEVRQLGQELQRRYVVWGHYGRTNAQWQITTRILEADTGKSSPDFTARAGFWVDAADEVVAQILRFLKLSPTAEEQRKMAERLTQSPAALEWAAKAAVAGIEEKPFEEVEALLRKALAADPESDSIRMFVVGALGAQDKLDEARELTRQVLASEPDSYPRSPPCR